MKFCPFCSSEYLAQNDGMGIFHSCSKCGSVVYSFAMLKRLGFNHKIFSTLLNSAKQNQTQFSGECISCENSYRKVSYETEGYKTTIYVCPICLQFAVKKIDFPLFKNPEPALVKPEKKYSADTEKLLAEIDDKLSKHQKSLEGSDKPIKMLKSRTVGFFIFLTCLIITFIRISFRYAISTGFGKFFLIFLFIILMIGGLFVILGRKNILTSVRRYFEQL